LLVIEMLSHCCLCYTCNVVTQPECHSARQDFYTDEGQLCVSLFVHCYSSVGFSVDDILANRLKRFSLSFAWTVHFHFKEIWCSVSCHLSAKMWNVLRTSGLGVVRTPPEVWPKGSGKSPLSTASTSTA